MGRGARSAYFVLLVVSAIVLAGCDETGILSPPKVEVYERAVVWSNYKTFKLGTVTATWETCVGNETTKSEPFDLHPLVASTVQDIIRRELSQKGYVEQNNNGLTLGSRPDLVFHVSITAADLYSPTRILMGNRLFVRIEAQDWFGQPLWMANVTSGSSLSKESLQSHILAGIKALPPHSED